MIEGELAALKLNFEIMGIDISHQDLRSIAAQLVPLATTMAQKP
jgi:hypothetical protein